MKSIWDISLEAANLMYFWASIAAIALGALTVLAAVLTFWASGVREKHSDQTIELARATASQANERTADIEQSNLKLKIELEKERAKREDLQQRLGPRSLTPWQIQIAKQVLSSITPNTVTAEIYWDHGDEIQNYAIQIATALIECGINIHRIKTGRILSSGRPTHGVGVSVLGGMGKELLSEALSAAQIATDTVIEKPPSTHNSLGRIGIPYNQCAVSIHVMPKPPSI